MERAPVRAAMRYRVVFVCYLLVFSPSPCHSAPPEVESSLASCRATCGKVKVMPCSCDVRCVVHSNCCEDFSTECPEVLVTARKALGWMLPADIYCNGDGDFIIKSCPSVNARDSREGVMTSSTYTTERSVRHESRSRHDDELSGVTKEGVSMATLPKAAVGKHTKSMKEIVREIIDNRPVTDIQTGFTYHNWTIFSCHVESVSRASFWTGIIRLNPHRFDMNSIPVLQQSYYTQITYTFDKEKVLEVQLAKCRPDSEHRCSERHEHFTEGLQAKCNSFISYAKPDIGEQEVYNNKYCLQCALGNQTHKVDVVQQYRPRTNFRFSATVDIQPQANTIILSSISSGHTWKTGMCLMGKSFDCRVLSCAPNYEQRPDGQCKKLAYRLFLFEAGEKLISKVQQDKIFQFLRCILEEFFDMEVDGSWGFSVSNSPIYRTTFYVLLLYTYTPIVNMTAEIFEHIHAVREMQMAANIIYKWALDKDRIMPQTGHGGTEPNKTGIDSHRTRKVLLRKIVIPKLPEPKFPNRQSRDEYLSAFRKVFVFKETIHNHTSMRRVCYCPSSIGADYSRLYCISVAARDEQENSTDLGEANCVRHLENAGQNLAVCFGGLHPHVHLVVVLLVVYALLLVL